MNKIIRKKSKQYTTLGNAVLRDNRLSLKAKGVVAIVMSLPSDWDFSIKGLSSVVKEGRDAVYAAIKELKNYGYCDMVRSRDEKGKLVGTDYVFYENPKLPESQEDSPCTENPDTENPYMEKPDTENPDTGNPDTENPTQYNKELIKEEINIINPLNPPRDSDEEEAEKEEITPKTIVDFYNQSIKNTPGCKVTKCIKLTDKRKEIIQARIKDFGVNKVYEAIEKVVKSKFCNGGGQSGWVADIDFVFNVNKMTRILEGKYDHLNNTDYDNTQLHNNDDLHKYDGGFW